jgi:hypothetical protein
MAYTTIDNPVEFFSATLYTGNATARTIATGHQSDWVWLKRRDGAAGHRIADSVRGATKLLYADSDTSEQTDAKSITGFVSTGFTLGDDANGYDVNTNTNTMVAWSWKAGTSFTNDASSTGIGTIDSTGSVNDTAGFSIVIRTGTASAGTIKHGLSTTPKMIITKMRNASENWGVYHVGIGNTKYLKLDVTDAEDSSSGVWNNTTPTTSVFSVGSSALVNGSSKTYVDYIFSEVKGYSKFGSYTGNGNADGTFVYTGFKPAFVLIKQTTDGSQRWEVYDNKRDGFNDGNRRLYPDGSDVEPSASDRIRLTANGFKAVTSGGTHVNGDGKTHIYMAFSESPFVNSNGVPNNAR